MILQHFPIGFQWPTVDPFLFCVHHLDHYPAGNADFGPVGSLQGRNIGQDFAGLDGWRMYHGEKVPGFPQHPHRGFETVTFVRRGLIDHSDSLGAIARYGGGDVQWLTAGSGIVHSEMFPLLDREGPNTVELFQIWVNLPSDQKMSPPHFTMLWSDDIPQVKSADDDKNPVNVTVIAGAFQGLTPPAPPPHSWAAKPENDVAIWHVQLGPDSSWVMPKANHVDTIRVVYVFDGVGAEFVVADGEPTLLREFDEDRDEVLVGNGVVIQCENDVKVTSAGGAELLVLQGRPIGEPVAQHGPFVMNDRAEIEQAFRDYQSTQFGGWPWASDDPVHGAEPQRFARRPNGSVERPRA